MKPGLLPMMLMRRPYGVWAYIEPSFPVGKTVAMIGPAGLAFATIGPAGKTLATIGPAGSEMEVPV